MSMDRMRVNSELLKSIDNNKKRINDSKQKSIESANKVIYTLLRKCCKK